MMIIIPAVAAAAAAHQLLCFAFMPSEREPRGLSTPRSISLSIYAAPPDASTPRAVCKHSLRAYYNNVCAIRFFIIQPASAWDFSLFCRRCMRLGSKLYPFKFEAHQKCCFFLMRFKKIQDDECCYVQTIFLHGFR
jgi:hypothetical protein